MFALLSNVLKSLSFPLIEDVERDYLNASVSQFDLERRQREVARGLFRNGSFDH
jgi:hypothetical protein